MGTVVDDILVQQLGQFGRGQLILLAVSGLGWANLAMQVFLTTFTAADPLSPGSWQCRSTFTQCTDAKGVCALPPGELIWTRPEHSVVAQFGLICGQSWKAAVLPVSLFMGLMVGDLVFGRLADLYGRKTVMYCCTGLTVAVTLGGAMATSFWPHIALRFLSGVFSSGMNLAGYVLMSESVGPAWRGRAGVLIQANYVLGEMVLVAFAWALPAWRHLSLAVAAWAAACLLTWPAIPESARWLQAVGRHDDALASLRWLARRNGRALTVEPPVPLSGGAGCQGGGETAASSGVGIVATGDIKEEGLASLFACRIALRYFATVCWCMLVLAISYYGVTLALGDLAGSLHVNFFLTALAELPAYAAAALLIDNIGRRSVIFSGTLLCAASLTACALAPRGCWQVALAMIGKFGCSIAWALAIIYVAEMFPTVVRTVVLGVGNQCADIGGIVTPSLLYVGREQANFDMLAWLVMGLSAALTAVIVLALPETNGKPQPDTFEDLLRNVAGHTIMEGPLAIWSGLQAMWAQLCCRALALPTAGGTASPMAAARRSSSVVSLAPLLAPAADKATPQGGGVLQAAAASEPEAATLLSAPADIELVTKEA